MKRTNETTRENILHNISNPIEFTERIYNSQDFRDVAEIIISGACAKLKAKRIIGEVTTTKPIHRLWLRGDLTFEFFMRNCVHVYFGVSRLPRSERDAVKMLLGSVLDNYRIRRNNKATERRRIKRAERLATAAPEKGGEES